MKRIITIVVFLLLFSQVCVGQWTKIGDFGARISSIYFHEFQDSFKVGFIGIGDTDGLFRTEDGGKTWMQTLYHQGPSSFTFKDSLNGWYVDRGSKVYATHDGGKTWIVNSDDIGGDAIYYNKRTNRLIKSGWRSPISYSIDDGKNWLYLDTTLLLNGIAFLNDSIGIVSVLRAPHSYRTTDGGLSWQENNFRQECWSPFVSLPSGTFYAPGEDAGNGLWKSSDQGISWYQPIQTDLRSKLTGVMQGTDCRLYIGTYEGIYRSLDTGLTWQFIGGPGNSIDNRALFVRGRHVFVGGEDGTVWHLYDSAADTRDLRMLVSSTIINFDTVGECSNPKQVIYFHNYRHCDIVKFLKVELIPFASNLSYSLGSGANTPALLAPESTDSVTLEFMNSGLGEYKAQLKITFLLDGKVVDTVISITGVRVSSGLPKVTPSLIAFDTITICEIRERACILCHNGCDSATVDIAYTPSAIYSISSPSFPLRVGPGERVPIKVLFKPTILGPCSDSIVFSVQQDSSSIQPISIKLQGVIKTAFIVPVITPKNLFIPPISFCDTESKLVSVTLINNSFCDSVIVRAVQTNSDTFELLSVSTGISLAPADSVTFAYVFRHEGKGLYNIPFYVQYFNGTSWLDSVMLLTTSVTDGTRILSSSGNTLDFGTMTLCQERDSVLTLRNTGCDTLRITNVDLLGNGFTTNISIPIIIAPGDSVTIPVTTKADTSQGNISTGSITFTSDADNQIAPIMLSSGYTYPKSYSFHVAMLDATVTSDEIVRLAIVGEQGLGSAGSGINRLDFDLVLNEDLLEYIRSESNNNVNKNGSRISISNQNELASTDDTLAILVYHVFLTKDSTTDIAVSNISINNGDTSSCAPKIAAITQAGFTYRYECGDKQIQSFLRNGKANLEITSIRPNPAKDYATIEIYSVEKKSIVVEIFDALGNRHNEFTSTITEGINVVTTSLSELPSGSYIVRITTDRETISARFVVSY